MDELEQWIVTLTKKRDEIDNTIKALHRAKLLGIALDEPVKRRRSRKHKNAWTPERRKAQGDRVRARHKANGADGEPTTAA